MAAALRRRGFEVAEGPDHSIATARRYWFVVCDVTWEINWWDDRAGRLTRTAGYDRTFVFE
jgi:hypothetical protein